MIIKYFLLDLIENRFSLYWILKGKKQWSFYLHDFIYSKHIIIKRGIFLNIFIIHITNY